MKCKTCYGTGRYESPELYYGVAECGSCLGSGDDPTTLCASCGRTYQDHIDDYYESRTADCEILDFTAGIA